jgi:hypothetical protein
MSYPDGARGVTTPIPLFSRNALTENGMRLGDKHNDNSRRLRETRFLISYQGDESAQCRTEKMQRREEESSYLGGGTVFTISSLPEWKKEIAMIFLIIMIMIIDY